jgi:hypothetical protein
LTWKPDVGRNEEASAPVKFYRGKRLCTQIKPQSPGDGQNLQNLQSTVNSQQAARAI